MMLAGSRREMREGEEWEGCGMVLNGVCSKTILPFLRFIQHFSVNLRVGKYNL